MLTIDEICRSLYYFNWELVYIVQPLFISNTLAVHKSNKIFNEYNKSDNICLHCKKKLLVLFFLATAGHHSGGGSGHHEPTADTYQYQTGCRGGMLSIPWLGCFW